MQRVIRINRFISTKFAVMNYAIVDIETTGGSPKDSKITEIAIYKHNGTEVIDSYETLVNPEMTIPIFVSRLTGITDKMVANAPKFYEIAKEIVEFTEDCIFVAHNVGFDYGIIRHEFRNLGFDYRRPHLCTVRASRHVLPGKESYSLGKLTKSLGIDLVGRHRAGGDALATAHLFTLLLETDKLGLKTFIQQEVNPKLLHPNLDVNSLDEIPEKAGIYQFYNDANQLIYIGKSKHIRKRIDQHLKNTKTAKGTKMIEEIVRIEYELTGSELIALLYESSLIKKHQPIYNRRLRKNLFPYGLFYFEDEGGYIHFHISNTAKISDIPLASFSSRKEGVDYLTQLVENNALCQKLSGLYATKSSCFHYEIKQCKGACIQEESTEDYNTRCQKVIDDLYFGGESFYLVDKGRHKSERSLVLIERGTFAGYGYAPFHFNNRPAKDWKRFIDIRVEDRDARAIISVFARKNELDKVKF